MTRIDLYEFDDELRTYIIENSPLIEGVPRFTEDNLRLGRLGRSTNGVYMQLMASPPPDKWIDTEWYDIDFWGVNTDGDRAKSDLRSIQEMFHQKEYLHTEHFRIYAASAGGQINDLDVDVENRQLFRLTMMFTTASLVS
jgi:hypothetical protein